MPKIEIQVAFNFVVRLMLTLQRALGTKGLRKTTETQNRELTKERD